MSTYLLHIAVGPVGAFISGGRRSRDLWFGSRLISEMTRAIAEHLKDAGGADLLIPDARFIDQRYVGAGSTLTHKTAASQEDHTRPVITNKVYATVPSGSSEEVRALAAAAETFARRILAELLESIETEGGRLPKAARRILATEGAGGDGEGDGASPSAQTPLRAQIDALLEGDFLEVYAVWTPYDEATPEGYRDAKRRVGALMAARKGARIFTPARFSREGLRKSDLDPGRDNILKEHGGLSGAKRISLDIQKAQVGIRDEERLDVIGLLRRLSVFWSTETVRDQSGEIRLPPLFFPPLARVAAEPWIRGAKGDPVSAGLLETIRSELDDALKSKGREAYFLLSSPCAEPKQPPDTKATSPLFDHDPSLLFEGDWEAKERSISLAQRDANKAHGQGGDDVLTREKVTATLTEASALLKDLEAPILRLRSLRGAPIPYYALLSADGDGMGQRFMDARSKADTKALRDVLYGFAEGAWKIVGEGHGGAPFYSGGDEIAAYLPADEGPAAALALSEDFSQRCAGAPNVRHGTLSVGIVLAHVRDDLRVIRREANRALERAKDRRKKDCDDADRPLESEGAWLTIQERPRGGSPRSVTGPLQYLVKCLTGWQRLLSEDLLSRSTAHGILRLAERYGAQGASMEDVHRRLLRAEVLERARRSGRLKKLEARLKELGLYDRLLGPTSFPSWEATRELAAELLIAERLRRVADQRHPTLTPDPEAP